MSATLRVHGAMMCVYRPGPEHGTRKHTQARHATRTRAADGKRGSMQKTSELSYDPWGTNVLGRPAPENPRASRWRQPRPPGRQPRGSLLTAPKAAQREGRARASVARLAPALRDLSTHAGRTASWPRRQRRRPARLRPRHCSGPGTPVALAKPRRPTGPSRKPTEPSKQ
jgi:hypothetical protein